MAHRIPRTVRLPFGYTVKVRNVSSAEMRDAIDAAPDEELPDGAWVSDDMTIYLLGSTPLRRRRYVLCHELQHAVTDLTHQQLIDGVGKP